MKVFETNSNNHKSVKAHTINKQTKMKRKKNKLRHLNSKLN